MTGVRSAALAAQLIDIGEGLAAALTDLSRDPEPARCEIAAIRLDGARRHCHLLAEAIRAERLESAGAGA